MTSGDILIIACVTGAVLALFAELVAWPYWQARRPTDWRDDWCSWDCWAPDGQDGPCEDCPWTREGK